MRRANSALRGCKAAYGPGNVKVHVKVEPSGKLASVKVTDAPSAGLGKCVVKAVGALAFPSSTNGASFDYLFPVR